MAVVDDGVVGPVRLLDLVQRLGDQVGPHAIAGEEGKTRFEEVEPPQRRELVEHQQQLAAMGLAAPALQLLGEPPRDQVEHQAHQRPRARQVRGRHDEIERMRPVRIHQVGDRKVAAAGGLGDDGVAVQAQQADRGRDHARALVRHLVHDRAGVIGDGRMHLGRVVGAEVVGRHHHPQRAVDGARRVGQETRDTGERLLLLGVEHVQDGANQQPIGGLLPVVADLAGTLGIDQDVGDVLHVPDLVRALAHLQQRIEAGGARRRSGRT